jgi:ribosomal protein S18 acetylase RimI-like enzyme
MTARPVDGRVRSLADAVRREGLGRVITRGLYRRGVLVMRYWWVVERPEETIPDALATLPEGMAFRELTEADLPELLTFPARGAPMKESHLRDAFAHGGRCLGVVRGAEIVGFGWWHLDATHSKVHPKVMGPREAYLHNMYVLPEVRGLKIAPILRYRTYQLLAAAGRDTFYSITAVSNIPSWRFKEKLGAAKLSLHWYLGIGERWHWRVTLRRFTPPSPSLRSG